MSAPESEPASPPKAKSKMGPKLVGLLIFVVAVASVFLIDWNKEVEEEPPIVRPIKTMVIEDTFAARGRTFTGKVSAGQQVNLSFEVSGNIIEQSVVKGDEVEAGQLLMRLDDRDYKNQVDAAQAEADRAKAQFERVEKAAETGAVSKQEVDNARAAFNQATANLDIRKKALKDTEMRAPYAGQIGDIFVKQFQTVQAKQKIISLNDLETVEINISIPEQAVATGKPENKDKVKLVAEFDFYPGEEFPVTVKEFAAQADSATQTYTATVEMPRPENRNLLPGMTATVHAYMPEELLGDDAQGFPVPLDAVPVDGLGQYYVWTLKDTGNDTFTVNRTNVEVGEIAGDDVVVTEGLAKNDRIALAGVHILTEGREVRLLKPGDGLEKPDAAPGPEDDGSDKEPGQ